MSRHLLILLFLSILTMQQIKAQSDFENAYILRSPSDTVYGKIVNNDFYTNSQYCEFKHVNSDSVIRYYPEKIYGYRFTNGKYYISKTVEFENKPVRMFVEYLVHGKLDLYFVMDKNHDNHFFVSKDSMPTKELKYSKEIKEVDGKQFFHETKSYIGILTYYTYDCQSIKNDIPNLNEPDQKKLIKFAEKYHNLTCTNEKCIVYEKRMTSKIKYDIIGGVNAYTNSDFASKDRVLYSFGMNILFQQKQNNEKMYLGIGFVSEGDIKNSEKSFSNYRIPFSINYIPNKQGFSPFISYVMDINRGFMTEAIQVGMLCHHKNISFLINGIVKTLFFVRPYGYGLNFGIVFDVR